jgi:hypothetical protein
MHPNFASAVETLVPSFERLIAMAPVTNGLLPPTSPKCGVYLFTESGRHLYVGRSNNIPRRYDAHRYGGANSSPFALKLARERTGKLVASYKPGKDSIAGLMKDPEFIAAFNDAKARIRRMEFRCVGEDDQMRQMLLEIYCTVALGTPYNDFSTH